MLETLQKIEFEKLNNDLNIGVYDYIPDEAEKTYCVIGDCSAEEFSAKTFEGYELTSIIYVYGLERSMIEVKRQIKEIINALKEIEIATSDYYFEFFSVPEINVTRIDLDLVQGMVKIKYRVEEE